MLEARLRELSRRRNRRRGRRVRPLHPHVSQPPERRLRVLPEGARPLPRGPGPARVTCTSSTCRSASRRAMRESFAAFKELVAEVSGEPLCGGRAPTGCSTSRMRSRKYEVNVARYYYNRGAYVAAIEPGAGGDRRLSADAGERRRARRAGQELRQARTRAARDDSLPHPASRLSGQHLSRRTRAKPWWKLW